MCVFFLVGRIDPGLAQGIAMVHNSEPERSTLADLPRPRRDFSGVLWLLASTGACVTNPSFPSCALPSPCSFSSRKRLAVPFLAEEEDDDIVLDLDRARLGPRLL